ncbi:putative protein N(5)-glutamine methyltransferase [Humibacter antri]
MPAVPAAVPAANDPASFDFDAVVARLRAAGCVFAEDEARLILDEASDPRELEAFVARRVVGEPLEYILGWAEFCGLRVSVAPGVFVPRQRTTLLVREALRVAPRAPVVLDLCCGAGAIGAGILAARPSADVHASDIDPVASDCARSTLVATRLAQGTPSSQGAPAEADAAPAGTGAVPAGTDAAPAETNAEPDLTDAAPDLTDAAAAPHVYTGDLYEPLPASLRGRVDVIVANAPYVPTDEIRLMPPEAREHEAQAALDGGYDGLVLQRRVAEGAREWLSPGGHVLIETSRRQASATAGILEAAGFSAAIVRDDEVDGTVAVGRYR